MSDQRTPALYQKLVLRPQGLSIFDLASIFGLSHQAVLDEVKALQARNLVSLDGDFVRAVQWWNQDYLEIFLNIPRVSSEPFGQYCKEIDQFCTELKGEGFDTIRPYSHETSIEILLGAAAVFAAVEFSKSFLSELGKSLAAFVEKTTKKFGDHGITEVEIKGTRKLKGNADIVFSVKGTNVASVTKGFADLIQSVEANRQKLEIQDRLILKGDLWELAVDKGDSMSKRATATHSQD